MESASQTTPPMKPNIIIVQPSQAESDSVVEQFCETLSETHYAYLMRPLSAFREDSPTGVRFLNYNPDRLPGFGDVECVVVVEDPAAAEALREKYPAAPQSLWRLDEDGAFPFHLVPALATIVRGDFGRTAEPELARAM